MRTFARLLLALAIALLPALALAQALDTGTRAELTDCASGGSSAASLTVNKTYLLRVTDSDVFICFAASGSTCASGGEKFPMGTLMRLNINGNQVSVSCRSGGSTGDVIFTRYE